MHFLLKVSFSAKDLKGLKDLESPQAVEGPQAVEVAEGVPSGQCVSRLRVGRRLLDLQLFANGEDKTEEPTPHRKREARKRGQVMKSMEMNSAVNLVGMVFFFVFYWPYFLGGFTSMIRHYYGDLLGTAVDTHSIDYLARFSLGQYVSLMAPVLLAALVLGLTANLLQVGFLVSTEVLKPQMSRISPVEGFKRIFSLRSLFEMVKSVLKIIIIGAVCYLYLRGRLPELMLLLGQEIGVVASVFGTVLRGLAFWVAAVFLFIAALDFVFQRYEYKKNLRMTRREVKEEYKHLEGDPHVRSRQRERQKAIAQERGLADVPESTVVITNPTELAVALRYIQEEDQAPVIVAMGAGRIAERIREIARENDIPVIQNPPVARLLYNHGEPGREIPVDLYQAVAEILAVVYRMQERRRAGRSRAAGA